MTTFQKTGRIAARVGALALALTVTACIVYQAQQNAAPKDRGEAVPADANGKPAGAHLHSSKSFAPRGGEVKDLQFLSTSKSAGPILTTGGAKTFLPSSKGMVIEPTRVDDTKNGGKTGAKKDPVFFSTSKSLVIDPPKKPSKKAEQKPPAQPKKKKE